MLSLAHLWNKLTSSSQQQQQQQKAKRRSQQKNQKRKLYSSKVEEMSCWQEKYTIVPKKKKGKKYIPKQDNKQNKPDLTSFRHPPIETDYAKADFLPRTAPDVGGQIPLV